MYLVCLVTKLQVRWSGSRGSITS